LGPAAAASRLKPETRRVHQTDVYGFEYEYDGDEPYLDFDVDNDGTTMTQTDTKQYLAGLAELDLLTSATTYFHDDSIRSLVMTTDDEGAVGVPPGGVGVSPASYTAFGEPILSDGQGGWTIGGDAAAALGTRYTYAGGWGYEAGLIVLEGQDGALPPLTLQHVGERWYDSALGRFIQRDPIGIAAGLNLYDYCGGHPLTRIDPTGLAALPPSNDPVFSYDEWGAWTRRGGWMGAAGGFGAGGLPGAGVGGLGGIGAGAIAYPLDWSVRTICVRAGDSLWYIGVAWWREAENSQQRRANPRTFPPPEPKPPPDCFTHVL